MTLPAQQIRIRRERDAIRSPYLSRPKAEVFYLHEFVDSVVGPFAAKPRLLDPAERCHLVRKQASVYADHSAFKALAAPNSSDIAL
jgi:hypothetical protein